MGLSNYARDTFVAPGLSEITAVGAPDLRNEAKGWINRFILTTVIKLGKEYRPRQLILHTLRKVEGAFQEYGEGREFLEVYVNNRAEISSYFHALRHFETAALLAYHAYDTIKTMISEKLFTQNDGSPLQRLNRLQNISKHANEELNECHCPEGFTVPIWITNTGLECYDKTELLFSELAELMTDLAKLAEKISNPPLPTQNNGTP